MENKILLIDSYSLLYRAFYALPPLQNSKGMFTNAIYGYLSMLFNLIEKEKPTHICAAFDAKGPTFRNDIFKDYKATRKPTPEELLPQIPLIKDILKALGIKIVEKEGFEADDIIGTLSRKFDFYTQIVSGDRDVLQLISNTTDVLLTKKGVSLVIKYDENELKKEGFEPWQIIEYKALAGDSSDNIPGAPGIGDKTARKLLEEYNNLENIFESVDKIKGKLGEKIRDNKDLIVLSKKLATICTQVEIDLKIEDLVFKYKPEPNFYYFLEFLEMKSIIKRFNKMFAISNTGESIVEAEEDKSKGNAIKSDEVEDVQKYLTKRLFSTLPNKIIEIGNLNELVKIIQKNIDQKRVAIYIDDDIFFTFDGKLTYKTNCKYTLFEYSFSIDAAINEFKNIFESKFIEKISFDIKSLKYLLEKHNITLEKPYEDVQLKEYLLRSHISYKNVNDLFNNEIDVTQYAVQFYNLSLQQIKDLKELSLYPLYYDIELPLIDILFDMEREGFSIDINMLLELSNKYNAEVDKLKDIVYKFAGKEFNINSNKQLAEVLYSDLGIPTQGKTKKGSQSVDAESLINIEHPIADVLLRYRTVSKLLSTYIDGMRNVINKKTGKIHTVFQQCVTATGRLSSTEPNMQNIPVRSEDGKEIRKMLVPSRNNILLTADYSQIELRLVASFSKDKEFIKSYMNNEDIHRNTAAKIFDLKLSEVNDDMRRKAKAINFGIIYGISAFGLSKNTSTTVKQASEFMNKYFEVHSDVKQYMDKNANFARENYYIRSIFNRIRFFPEFEHGSRFEQEFAMRAAKNMPLQGSSSDIIKKAMIMISEDLKVKNLKAKMILQVHDELIFDVPKSEIEIVKKLVKENMQKAAVLEVPLIVDVKTGENWYEAS